MGGELIFSQRRFQHYMLTASSAHKKLFPFIYEINQLSIRHIHPSWLEKIPFSTEVLFLKDYKRSQKKLSDFSKEIFQLENIWETHFDSKFSRFILISNGELMRLAHYLGIVCVSPVIKKVIDGGQLRYLKSILGTEDFEFIKKASPFYYPQKLAEMVKIKPARLDDADELNSYIETAGIRCLALMYASESALLKKRMMLKLPKSYSPILDFLVTEDQMEKSLEESLSIYKIAKKLIEDLNITCRPIFA